MGSKNHQTPWENQKCDPQVYRTGATAPQKSYRGIIAVLLVAVIILGGAVSILGIMNIQLFRQLAKDTGETLPFLLSSHAPEYHEVQPPTAWTDSIFPENSTELSTLPTTDVISPNGLRKDPTASDTVHGIGGEPVSAFNQHYYQLPQGLYITEIAPDSCAAAAGLRSGDILLCLNGSNVADLPALQAFFEACSPGTTIALSVYRNGETISLSFVFPDKQH